MAVIEVSEEGLRRAADGALFARALEFADSGKVSDLRVGGSLLSAIVAGVPVGVRILADGIEGRCECDMAPCPHAVAAALAWVRAGRDEDEPDLYEVLVRQSPEWLASRLADLAAGIPSLTAVLLADVSDAEAPDALDELRGELDEILDELEEQAAEEGSYGEWYPTSDELTELIRDADEYLEVAPDETRELADHAIARVEDLLNYENCYGDLETVLTQAQELHLAACEVGSPDLRLLAERLVTGRLESGWGVFDDGIARYAGVLGADGLARCRELLETARRGHARDELLRSLARAQEALDAES